MAQPQTTPSLPKKVITEDRRLDQTQTKAAEALMRLRWHWTLDKSNADRVSMNAYAAAVSKSRGTIQRDAKGYALMKAPGSSGRATSPNEARGRANMGAESQAATEAVAEARGVSFQQ